MRGIDGRNGTQLIRFVLFSAGMRAELERKNLPNVKVLDGDAGNIPAEDEWADTLITAQVS